MGNPFTPSYRRRAIARTAGSAGNRRSANGSEALDVPGMPSPTARGPGASGRGRRRVRPAGRPVLEQLPPAVEFAVDALEVVAHGRPRGPRVARLEGDEDGLVVAERRGAKLRGLEVVLHALPDVAAPAVPQVLHDGHEGAVVGGPRDPEVKVPVGGLRALLPPLVSLHLRDRGPDRLDLVRLGRAGGFGRHLALDEGARAQ